MKIHPLSLSFTFALASASCAQQPQVLEAPQTAPAKAEAVTITVARGARQEFGGLGTSIGNWGRDYQKLSRAEQLSLSKMLWGDLKMTSIRLWENLDEYEPRPGVRDASDFRARYIDSGLVKDAQALGVKHILLAPDAMPAHMKQKREGGGADFVLKDDSIEAYGALIADFILQARREGGLEITATGVQNEPNDLDRITPEQMPRVVKALRKALDARGLQKVALIGPESANVDGVLYDTLDRLQADKEAWGALEGLASHSYNMAANDNVAKRIELADGSNSKTYWQTEASANGAEEPGDALQGASLAARFLSDMNHRTTHWIHFLGFEIPDANDNATRIFAYETKPLKLRTFQKYFYYRQLADTFDVGARFRDSTSSLDGDMTWTYGKKPRVFSASAQNADGSWGVGVANFTAPTFNDDPNEVAGYANGWKARTFEVTIEIPELKTAGEVTLQARRSNSTLNAVVEAPVVMRDGRAKITVNPLDLVTLRSPKAPVAVN